MTSILQRDGVEDLSAMDGYGDVIDEVVASFNEIVDLLVAEQRSGRATDVLFSHVLARVEALRALSAAQIAVARMTIEEDEYVDLWAGFDAWVEEGGLERLSKRRRPVLEAALKEVRGQLHSALFEDVP